MRSAGDAAQKEARIAELARLQAESSVSARTSAWPTPASASALADAVATKDARIMSWSSAWRRKVAPSRRRSWRWSRRVRRWSASATRWPRRWRSRTLRKPSDERPQRAAGHRAQGKDDIIAYKEGEIERYKDMKAPVHQEVGESLEQHCETEFNKIRAAAFPRVLREGQRRVRGLEGRLHLRECDEGNEIVSIMFEMKNESDDSSHRHKNEDFFKKLDADRRKKVRVRGAGHVARAGKRAVQPGQHRDVSYRFEKMYAIRPQFFLPMISILRNAR